MARQNVDPYCGHLWSRHLHGTICPPDAEYFRQDEKALINMNRTAPQQVGSGPAAPSEDDDPADFRTASHRLHDDEEVDYTIRYLPRDD